MAAINGCTNPLATNYAPLALHDDGSCVLPNVIRFNITGELTQQLLAAGNNIKASSISLTNVDPSHSSTVDLYIEKKLTGKFYLLKNVVIPVGVTLTHDIVSFNNKVNEFSLYIKLTKAATFTLTGSIDPAASTTVPGSGTLFLTEVSIGDEIVVSGETRIVTAIASNTSLTVSLAFSDNANDTSPDCNPVAPVDVILY
tara:strand:- start:48 stop:644 length:597 start_codon:yes stop_codon:yes gene_type:complete